MTKFKTTVFISVILLLLIGCSSGTNFMGAQKWNVRAGMYIERWYLNPQI